MVEKNWKTWQTRRNKLSIVSMCITLFFVLMCIFIMFGLFTQEDLQNFWNW